MHFQSFSENKVKKYLVFLKVLRKILLQNSHLCGFFRTQFCLNIKLRHLGMLHITIIQVNTLNFYSSKYYIKQKNIYTGRQKANQEEMMLSVLKSKDHFQILTKNPICLVVSSVLRL